MNKAVLTILFYAVITILWQNCILAGSNDSICSGQISVVKEKLDSFQLYQKKGHIPKSFRHYYKEIKDQRFRMVNPHKKYRSNDVLTLWNRFRPSMQMVLLGHYKNQWILVFNHGGMAFHQHCVLFEINNHQVERYCDLATENIENIGDLITFFKVNRFHKAWL